MQQKKQDSQPSLSAFELPTPNSRGALLVQSVVARRLALLSHLVYRGTDLPRDMRDSVPTEVYTMASYLAQTETPCCDVSFSEPVNEWLQNLPPDDVWPFLIPAAVHCLHGLPPSGLQDGYLTAPNDTYIPEIDDFRHRHPFDRQNSLAFCFEKVISANIGFEIADSLSALQLVQSHLISKYILGEMFAVSPLVLSEAVNLAMECDRPIYSPEIKVHTWLPDAVMQVTAQVVEDGGAPKTKSFTAVAYPYGISG